MKRAIYISAIVLAISCSNDNEDEHDCPCEEVAWKKYQNNSRNEMITVNIRPCELDDNFIENAGGEQAQVRGERQGCEQP